LKEEEEKKKTASFLKAAGGKWDYLAILAPF